MKHWKLKLFTDADLTEQVGETKEITIEDVIPTYSVKTSGRSSIAEGGTLKQVLGQQKFLIIQDYIGH